MDLELDVLQLKQLLDEPADMLLLDCREPQEHELVHLQPARLIPMDEIPQRLAELEPHRQGRIVVYCHLGGRSLHVAHWLRQQGFAQAQSLAGGIDAWAEQIDPSLPRY